MMKKRLLVFIVAIAMLFICCACGNNQTSGDETPTPEISPSETVTSTPTDAPAEPTATPFPEGPDGSDKTYDEVAANAQVSVSDALKVHEPIGWWDNWARFNATGDPMDAFDANSDTIGSIYNDEGRGPFLRETSVVGSKGTVEQAKLFKLKVGAWIELQGDSRNMLIALHQLEDGSFEMNEETGSAKVIANAWSWASSGPGKNPNANYLAWGSIHSFVNNEEWAEPFTIQNYPELALPTYPDGTVAQGYLEGGDRLTPHLATFYDACGAKDINGQVVRYDEFVTVSGFDDSVPGIIGLKDYKGNMVYSDDFSIGKDSSAPFWAEYAAMTVDYLVANGTDFFWIDNWNGWDNVNNNPLKKAFGDWSEYKFRELLKSDTTLAGEVANDFSISAYIKQRCLELDPDCPVDNLLGYGSWTTRDASWAEDPVWLTYIAFKSKENTAHNSAVFKAIKDAALKYNGDAESVAVCANDFPYLTFSACDGETLDLVHTEFGNYYSAATGFSTSGPTPYGYSGHAMSLLSDTTRSTQAVLWYYGDEVRNLAYMYGYEALAYNCTLYGNKVGTQYSTGKLNESVGVLREFFSDRRLYAEIGVVYSADSELSTLAPGGFVSGEKNPTDLSYMGWCHAFDELNIPYRGIQADRLADRIDLCKVVILPHVRSISKDVIDNVLRPWLDKGNVLIVTGDDAGHVDSVANDFRLHESNILVDFANEYAGNGKVIYYETDPMIDYFIYHAKVDMETLEELYLNDLKTLINGFIEDGTLNSLLELENLPVHAVTTLNYSPLANNFFVDIVNMQYNVDEDVLTNIEAGVKVKVRLPSSLWGERLNVKLFLSETRKVVDLIPGESFSIDGEYAYITLPEIEFYASIIFTQFDK